MHQCSPAIRRATGDHRRMAGFTLVEMVITAAILALAVSVVLPAATNFGLASLRKETRMVSGTIRATYDDAALNGQIYRLVFAFKERQVRVESTEAILQFEEGSNALVASEKLVEGAAGNMPASPFVALGVGDAQSMLGVDSKGDDAGDKRKNNKEDGAAPNPAAAFLGMNRVVDAGGGVDGGFQPVGKPLQLGDTIHLHDVWVDGMDEPATEGEVYLHFFPHGYTQDAVIHLADDDGRIFAVRVWPLTGKVEVINHYVEAPKK